MASETQERVDGINQYYQPVELLDRWTSRLFWLTVGLSVAVLYADLIKWKPMKNIVTLIFVVSAFLHLASTIYLRFVLIPTAEGKRRKQLLSDSFGVPLTPEQTKRYYNNQLAPSVRRLGANILENSLFAKAVCGKMAIQERKKVLCYFLVWTIAAIWRGTPIDFLVVITQTVFSGEIIAKLVSLEILRIKNENLFDELYHEFLHKIDFSSQTGTACILDAFASYEAAKAAASLKQSTSIFNELNPQISREWDKIRKQLGIDWEEPIEPIQ